MIFFSVVFLLLKDLALGIIIAEFFFLSPDQDSLDPVENGSKPATKNTGYN
jgi:hypothetical protein